MYKDKNITLVSFATLDLKRSISRFKTQAINSNYYDQIKIFTPEDLKDSDKKKIEIFLKQGKKRGFAYWYWKPLLLTDIFKKIKDNDIIQYLDIGFHINKTISNRFYEYLDLLNQEETNILGFQYYSLKNNIPNDIQFPSREEFKYTKGDLFKYFNKLNDQSITHTPQFSAGNFFIKKNKMTEIFLSKWTEVFEKRFDLIDDTPSTEKNFPGFIENRHDQSVFSLLCKISSVKALSAYEFDWAERNNKRTWSHIIDNPFFAKRDLKYNLFKRFFIRQLKTLRRIKKKFL